MKNYTLSATTTVQVTDIRPSHFLRFKVGNADINVRLQLAPRVISESEQEEFRTLEANKTYKVKLRKNACWAVSYKTTTGTATATLEAGNEETNIEELKKADILPFDVTVTTAAAAINTDSAVRDEITLLADSENTAVIKIGKSGTVLFPLVAGASVTVKKTRCSLVFAQAVTGSQTLHVLTGGD